MYILMRTLKNSLHSGDNKMNIQKIKQRLEDNERFKEYHDRTGVTFEDFKIVDIPNNKILQDGSKKIEGDCIMILDDDKLQVHYDLI